MFTHNIYTAQRLLEMLCENLFLFTVTLVVKLVLVLVSDCLHGGTSISCLSSRLTDDVRRASGYLNSSTLRHSCLTRHLICTKVLFKNGVTKSTLQMADQT